VGVALALCVSGLFVGGSSVSAADGNLDSSFGTAGKVMSNMADTSQGADRASDIAINPDGSFLVVGYKTVSYDFVIAKYLSSGVLDSSFGTNGRVVTSFGTGADVATSVEILSNGSFVVAGTSSIGGQDDFAVAKYTASGVLDTAFGTAGKVTTDVSGTLRGDSVSTMAISKTGEVYVAGYSRGSTIDLAVVKYTSAGVLDTSFSSDGIVAIDFFSLQDDARTIQVLTNGSVLVGGYANNGNGDALSALVKLTSGGELDQAFGTGGKVTGDHVNYDEEVSSVSISATGEIFAAVTGVDFTLVKYSSFGVLQTTFGISGIASTDFSGGTDYSNCVQVLVDGSVLVSGFATISGSADFAVAKFSSAGILDNSFGISGRSTVSFTSGDDVSAALAVGVNGQIMLAGTADSNGAQADFAIAKFQGGVPVVATTTTTTSTTSIVSGPTSTTSTTSIVSSPTTAPVVAQSIVPLITRSYVTAISMARYAKISVPAGSEVTLKVYKSTAKRCRVSRKRIRKLKAGTCLVKVTVRTKNGKSKSATTKIRFK
jgi:uncharacterized delta-60 repeat protein